MTKTDMTQDYAIKENAMPDTSKVGIFRVANTSLYRVAYTGNGAKLKIGKDDYENHKALEGMFTAPHKAQEALTKYLMVCWERVKKQPEVPTKPLSNAELQKNSDKGHAARA